MAFSLYGNTNVWNVLVVDYSASAKSLIVDGKIGTIIFKAVTGIQNHM